MTKTGKVRTMKHNKHVSRPRSLNEEIADGCPGEDEIDRRDSISGQRSHRGEATDHRFGRNIPGMGNSPKMESDKASGRQKWYEQSRMWNAI